MFLFLETNCSKTADEEQIKIYDSYSKTILNYLKKFEQISDEMS